MTQRTFFITGTDTEIGKTYVTCCVAHSLKQQYPKWKICPRKPIASGAIWQGKQLISEDALQLQQACKSDDTLPTICPHTFEAAISPERAIRQAQQDITIDTLVSGIPNEDADIILVEGAGGFYSPLALDGSNADLAKKLQAPVILVVGNRLGCINHALLSIEAIQSRGLVLALVVINDVALTADKDNATDLINWLNAEHINAVHLPYQKSACATATDWQIIPNLDALLAL